MAKRHRKPSTGDPDRLATVSDPITGELFEVEVPSSKDRPAAVPIQDESKGGTAEIAGMTGEERKEAARKAAEARRRNKR